MSSWIVVMGVAGSGKSTLGAALAEALALPFLEGDAFHPPANVAKMAAGVPLTDEDRWPWLDALAAALREAEAGAVMTCSALRLVYRERLRAKADHTLSFVWLKLDRDTLAERMGARVGHYMPASLLDSQLATLEAPETSEGVIVLDAHKAPGELLAEARAALS